MTMGMPMMGPPQEPPKPPKPEDGSVMAYLALAEAICKIGQGTQRVIVEDGTILSDPELKKMAFKLMTDLEMLNVALVKRIPAAREKEESDRKKEEEENKD